MRTPYEIYKFSCVSDLPPKVSFSVWFDEQKARYIERYPEARQGMIDGAFRNRGEMERFFVWLDLEHPKII
jgi:hypothetical protein